MPTESIQDVFAQATGDSRSIVLNFCKALSTNARTGAEMFAAAAEISLDDARAQIDAIKQDRLQGIVDKVAELDAKATEAESPMMKSLYAGQRETWLDKAMVLMNEQGASFERPAIEVAPQPPKLENKKRSRRPAGSK